MKHRLRLQAALESIEGLAVDPHTHRPAVYFQPPPSVKLVYPCIIYDYDRIEINHADDKPYRHTKGYSITVIDKDPDSGIPDAFYEMPLCRLDRTYTADNLNHWVFSLFY